MIKTFSHPIDGEPQSFCITLAESGIQPGTRALISRAETPETLVIIEPGGPLASIKVRLESPEAFLDDALRKALAESLIEKALATGEVQTGQL